MTDLGWMEVFTALVVMAWLPVLWHFLNAWRARHNPVSLAICLTILLLIYGSFTVAEYMEGVVDAQWFWGGFLGFEALVCLNFYVAFWWANRRFKNTRT